MNHAQSLIVATIAVSLPAGPATAQITLQPIGTHATGIFGGGAAEIAAHDPATQRVFSVNTAGNAIDVLDVSDPTSPAKLFAIDVTPFGSPPSSVDFRDGVLAVAVANPDRTLPGMAAFFDANGGFLSAVGVGALPDMITFTPNGRRVLVANEGEPDDAYAIDPEGSVSIIDMTGGAAAVTQADVVTASFSGFTRATIDPDIRIFGANNPTVAQDLEPEYIAVSHDSKTAWVTLQENNAIAILDVDAGMFTSLVALGFKDHRLPENAFDASDRDGAINIRSWPVLGMYQPDAIASYRVHGRTYLVTANEGDSRDYRGFSEEARVSGLMLDPVAFPDPTLKQSRNLGRLTVTRATGDTDGDPEFERLHAFGARSFSIWDASGSLVFDSADDLERITAAALPGFFNDSGTPGGFDTRSDNKGPEPEGVAIGKAFGRTYAFIGLERIGGVMVYDISDPHQPRFVQYVNNRGAGDVAPEGLLFIRAEESPGGKPLLVVSNEVSGTTTIFEVAKTKK